MVNKQNHKIIVAKPGERVQNVHWHVHISLLASPGDATKNEIRKYLLDNYPFSNYVKIIPDYEGCGETTQGEVRYVLEQGVIVRTVAVGDINKLGFKDTYQGYVKTISKELDYGSLKITSI